MNINFGERKKVQNIFSVYAEYSVLQNVCGKALPTRASTSYQRKPDRTHKLPKTSSYLEAFCFNQLHSGPGHYMLMLTI